MECSYTVVRSPVYAVHLYLNEIPLCINFSADMPLHFCAICGLGSVCAVGLHLKLQFMQYIRSETVFCTAINVVQALRNYKCTARYGSRAHFDCVRTAKVEADAPAMLQ